MDTLTPKARSANMAKIRSKNTRPELAVRKLLWKMNIRYRIHTSSLPGKPDIYIPRLKTAVFIHGCFWHQHKGCRRCSMPKSNVDYWEKKLTRNVQRFAAVKKELKSAGYKVAVIWECEITDKEKLIEIIQERIID